MEHCTEPVEIEFLGRACPKRAASVQLFGAVALPPTPYQANYQAFTGGVTRWDECNEPGAWTLQTTALEIQREVDEGNLSPFPPGFQGFTDPTQLPAGAQAVRRSQIKLRVTAGIGAANRRFDMDSNQTLELNAERVCVDWLAPSNFYDVRDLPAGSVFPTRQGFVTDVQLGVSLARIEAPVGNREVVLTTHVFVPLDTQVVIQVPPFATKVTVYQDPTLGVAAVLWTMLYGDPAVLTTTIPHGTLPFIPGARKSEPDIELADTTHLQTDQAATDRFFTMRWTIRP